jgi:hypothetical protein
MTGKKLTEAKIRRYMSTITEDCRDECGEVDATLLAEMACADLDGWDGDDIPEVFFEVAGWLVVQLTEG